MGTFMASKQIKVNGRLIEILCPEWVEVTTFGSAQPEWLCGCGQCPEPDPTPEQLMARVESQWWRMMREPLTA